MKWKKSSVWLNMNMNSIKLTRCRVRIAMHIIRCLSPCVCDCVNISNIQNGLFGIFLFSIKVEDFWHNECTVLSNIVCVQIYLVYAAFSFPLNARDFTRTSKIIIIKSENKAHLGDDYPKKNGYERCLLVFSLHSRILVTGPSADHR